MQDDYKENLDEIDVTFVLQTLTSAVPYKFSQMEEFVRGYFEQELAFYETDHI